MAMVTNLSATISLLMSTSSTAFLTSQALAAAQGATTSMPTTATAKRALYCMK